MTEAWPTQNRPFHSHITLDLQNQEWHIYFLPLSLRIMDHNSNGPLKCQALVYSNLKKKIGYKVSVLQKKDRFVVVGPGMCFPGFVAVFIPTHHIIGSALVSPSRYTQPCGLHYMEKSRKIAQIQSPHERAPPHHLFYLPDLTNYPTPVYSPLRPLHTKQPPYSPLALKYYRVSLEVWPVLLRARLGNKWYLFICRFLCKAKNSSALIQTECPYSFSFPLQFSITPPKQCSMHPPPTPFSSLPLYFLLLSLPSEGWPPPQEISRKGGEMLYSQITFELCHPSYASVWRLKECLVKGLLLVIWSNSCKIFNLNML